MSASEDGVKVGWFRPEGVMLEIAGERVDGEAARSQRRIPLLDSNKYLMLMPWSIEYYDDSVERAILKLPTGLLARYLRLTDLLVDFGPNLGMPHTRTLGEGLIELRVKAKEGIARVFYCSVVEQRIVVLHAFVKKTQKIPKRELDTARRRLREVRAR